MCTVTGILSIILSVASTVVSSDQQRRSRHQQADMAKDAARNAQTADLIALKEQQDQINDEASAEAFERMKQGMRERGMIRVATGEAGLAGATPMRELANSFLQEKYDMSILETNRENRMSQSRAQANKINATARGRMNAANVPGPSGWATGLQIGTTLASGLGSAYRGYQGDGFWS